MNVGQARAKGQRTRKNTSFKRRGITKQRHIFQLCFLSFLQNDSAHAEVK